MGHDEAAAVLAGALAAGVTSGVARPLTGGLVADLGVAESLQRARGRPWVTRPTPTRRRSGATMTLDETVAYVFSVLDVAELAAP